MGASKVFANCSLVPKMPGLVKLDMEKNSPCDRPTDHQIDDDARERERVSERLRVPHTRTLLFSRDGPCLENMTRASRWVRLLCVSRKRAAPSPSEETSDLAVEQTSSRIARGVFLWFAHTQTRCSREIVLHGRAREQHAAHAVQLEERGGSLRVGVLETVRLVACGFSRVVETVSGEDDQELEGSRSRGVFRTLLLSSRSD